MYKVGDKVIFTKTYSGYSEVGKGSWGYVTELLEDYGGGFNGVEVCIHFYRQKYKRSGVSLLTENEQLYVYPKPNQIDHYSNVVSIQSQVIDKVRIMAARQPFKFKGECCG